MNKIELLGINVSSVSISELNNEVRKWFSENRKRVILNVNIHGMNLSSKNEWMVEFFNNSDVVLCDGTGVYWASKVVGEKIKERISLTDWGWPLAEIMEEKGQSLFLLGSPDQVLEKSVINLKKKYPNLNISGKRNGFFDVHGDENMEVINQINHSGTDVLLVGMGMPRQEKWVLDNIDKLNVKMVVTCGAMFYYYSGDLKRSPFWVSKIGMEWFHRFLKEPRRLFFRYFPGNFTFFLRIFRQKLSRRYNG